MTFEELVKQYEEEQKVSHEQAVNDMGNALIEIIEKYKKALESIRSKLDKMFCEPRSKDKRRV